MSQLLKITDEVVGLRIDMGAAALLEKDEARKEEARLGALTAGLVASGLGQPPETEDVEVYVDGVRR